LASIRVLGEISEMPKPQESTDETIRYDERRGKRQQAEANATESISYMCEARMMRYILSSWIGEKRKHVDRTLFGKVCAGDTQSFLRISIMSIGQRLHLACSLQCNLAELACIRRDGSVTIVLCRRR